MHFFGVLGCVLQAYGPCVPLYIYFLRARPQLNLICIAGGFFYVLAAMFVAVLWHIPGMEDHSAVTVALGVLFIELFRVLFFKVIHWAETGFSAKGAHLYLSPFAMAPIALASGLGFGLVESLLQFGTLLSFEVQNPLATYYDTSSCPNIPFLYSQALHALCFLLLNVCWMVIAFHCLNILSSPALAGEDDEGTVSREATRTTRARAIIGLVILWLLHLCSSLVTLFNDGVKNGCSVSLPLLFSLAGISGAVAWNLTISSYRPLPPPLALTAGSPLTQSVTTSSA
eukprot:TRINITY_DN9363_c0_g1_i1.p1 TRINITY_DN9363_c0_g1~~TRINITY_DN9363_c0_g1_i1.p1  ORF type:complete len:296 (-),score=38.07 TRINITY_DN9363_c0_g1_i1:29-883(-)